MQAKIENILTRYNLRLWHLLRGDNVNKNPVWRIFIDDQQNSGKISLDLCEEVSKEIATVVDVDFEVSSPGIERNLYTLEHYRLFLHNKIKVAFRNEEGTFFKKLVFLEALEGTKVIFKDEYGTIFDIDFQNIVWAKLNYDFGGKK